jgi:hypothetical protein
MLTDIAIARKIGALGNRTRIAPAKATSSCATPCCCPSGDVRVDFRRRADSAAGGRDRARLLRPDRALAPMRGQVVIVSTTTRDGATAQAAVEIGARTAPPR